MSEREHNNGAPQDQSARPDSGHHGGRFVQPAHDPRGVAIEPLDGRLFGAGQPCFGCGPRHPAGFRLRFEREGDEVVTRFTPGGDYQGPPGIMHGGLVMTLADEVADWAIIALRGKFGFTAQFSGKLVRPVRIHQPLEARARITGDKRRVMDVAVDITQSEERAFEASFRFVILDRSGAERLLGGPLPDRWRRFCR